MAHRLADLLEHNHPLFTYNIGQLERAAGDAGIDTRLLAEIDEKSHTIIVQLGLDRNDTTPEELYHALGALDETARNNLLKDTQYTLASKDGEVISFNLEDVIENAHHQLDFAHRQSESAKRHLRAEIIKRYADSDRTDNTLVQRLAEEAGLTPARDEGRVALPVASDANRPKLLAIGDIFTDAFIELREESAKIIHEEDGTDWLALPFGQKPPYDHVDIVRSVGPSPNAAVSTARIGLDVSLMAWVGADATGKEAIAHLKGENIATDTMVVENDKNTSYWYVLRYKADRTMLVKSEKYAYEWQDPAEVPEWVYLSYIGEDSWPLHEKLLEYLERHPETKLVFQPGTFHFQWGVEKLAGIYKRAELIVLNREEAVDVTGGSHDNLRELADKLHALGPKIAVITDGPNGSYASYDGRLVTIPNYPDIAPPLDRTGAGDAFASTIVAALALGEDMETALKWAPINSMNVVQKMGAQAGLQTREQIEEWLKKAPEDYKVTDL